MSTWLVSSASEDCQNMVKDVLQSDDRVCYRDLYFRDNHTIEVISDPNFGSGNKEVEVLKIWVDGGVLYMTKMIAEEMHCDAHYSFHWELIYGYIV